MLLSENKVLHFMYFLWISILPHILDTEIHQFISELCGNNIIAGYKNDLSAAFKTSRTIAIYES